MSRAVPMWHVVGRALEVVSKRGRPYLLVTWRCPCGATHVTRHQPDETKNSRYRACAGGTVAVRVIPPTERAA